MKDSIETLTRENGSLERMVNAKKEQLYTLQIEINRKTSTPLGKLKRNLFNERSKFGKIATIFWGLTVGPALIAGPLVDKNTY